MNRLKRIDKVAYVRFASVYLDLKDVREFMSERVLQFLDERGMVIPDPARQGTAVQRTIQQRIQALPEGIGGELLQWVKVVRGEGRRAHRELPFATIRSYLNCLYPVLADWSQHITSLREITRDDVQAALGERPGVTARNLLPALRSLFRALKQERIIFRGPDPRDHPVSDAPPARPDPHRPAPRPDRPGRAPR